MCWPHHVHVQPGGAGAQLPIGTSHVTVLAEDESGNDATFAMTVVVRDTTPLVLTAPNMPVEGNTTCGAIVSAYAATDNDAVAPVTLAHSIPPG